MDYIKELRSVVGHQTLLIPGTRCVLIDVDGRVLLEERADLRVWGLPGGNAEVGESIIEVARRELNEELGVTVETLTPFGYGTDPAFETVRFPNGDVCQFFSLMFWAEIKADKVRAASDESLRVAWFGFDDLPAAILPNMRRSLDAFQEFRRTGTFQMI